MSEREQRQLRLMEERLRAFRRGEVGLPSLVNDLYALLDALEEAAQEWRDEFTHRWAELEIAWAVVADDRGVQVPTIADPGVAEAVTDLEALITRHPASN